MIIETVVGEVRAIEDTDNPKSFATVFEINKDLKFVLSPMAIASACISVYQAFERIIPEPHTIRFEKEFITLFHKEFCERHNNTTVG